MDQITIKTPNPKCRLYWCLREFIDSQPCWYFRPLLGTSASLTFSLVDLPPSPLPCMNKYRGMYEFIQCVTAGGEGWDQVVWRASTGVIHCVMYLTRFEPTKLLYHPKQKTRRGGGLRRINTCRQSPLQVNF
jgi:hypothetical protein